MPGTTVEQLLEFIPRFDAGEFESAQSVYISTGEYLPVMNQLRPLLQAAGLDLPDFDWQGWTEDAQPFLRDPALIAQSSPEELKKLFTIVTRSDDFNRGLFPYLCQSGFLLQLLLRVRQLSA